MAKKEFHKKHTDGTKTKLALFDKYFNECLPVFIHSGAFENIFIYDLFAGKGKDENGDYGTSLNIIKGLSAHCPAIVKTKTKIYIILNDKKEFCDLEKNVKEHLSTCKEECSLGTCILTLGKNLILKGSDFDTYFNDTIHPKLQNLPKSAKIIFLDPFNFIMNNVLFEKLTNLTTTDFICFMPSSYLKRFYDTSAFKDFIDKDENGINFNTARPNECHRVIAQYFNALVGEKEYFIGHFSIKYHPNIYGVIFGTNHTLGAEKFQRVCWDIDKIIGEANYDIDREPTYNGQKTLFPENIPLKIGRFNDDLINAIKTGDIKTDLDAYKFALKRQCLPKHAADVLTQMMNKGQINSFKTTNSDIHRIKNIPQNIHYNETI